MGRIILTPGGPRHPLEARAPAVRDEATVIIFLAVHSPSTPKVKVFPYTGSAYDFNKNRLFFLALFLFTNVFPGIPGTSRTRPWVYLADRPP